MGGAKLAPEHAIMMYAVLICLVVLKLHSQVIYNIVCGVELCFAGKSSVFIRFIVFWNIDFSL